MLSERIPLQLAEVNIVLVVLVVQVAHAFMEGAGRRLHVSALDMGKLSRCQLVGLFFVQFMA